MKIKPNFDVKKWCIYNESTFELELKNDAPKKIKKEFEKWKQEYNNDELLKEVISEEFKNY